MADAHQRGQITNGMTKANHKQAQAVRGVQTQHKRAHTRTINANTTTTTITRDAGRKEDNEREKQNRP